MAAPKGNKYAQGSKTNGRPAMYKNVKELTDKITEYFTYILGEYQEQTVTVNKRRKDEATGKMKLVPETVTKTVCIRQPERPKVSSLARWLGFESRKSLNDYSKKKDFSYPIKRALLIIEEEYEDMLPYAKGSGVIFALKNMGWEDKTTVDNNHSLNGKPEWLGVAASKKDKANN